MATGPTGPIGPNKLGVLPDVSGELSLPEWEREEEARIASLEPLADQFITALFPSSLNAVVKPTGPSPFRGTFRSLFGFSPREYQKQWLASLASAVESGRDRGLIRAPAQVGKSLSLGPFAHQVGRRYFPGKTTLYVYPHLVIGSQAKDDLNGFPGRVGFVDANNKDLEGDYDLIVASAFTLGRAEHLKRLNPDRFGLVIVDEATFALAKTWKQVLKHLGFLDPQGNVQRADGKFLLGLTADPFSLKNVFGESARLDAHEMPWYIGMGYLHRPVGKKVSYRIEKEQFELLTQSGETIATPKKSELYDQAVVGVYEENFKDQKALVNAATIDHAESLEAAFNKRFGPGFARAIHSKMSQREAEELTKAYSRGDGPKVLISIWKLAYGFRAVGTHGIINTYETNSLRRYGQRIGRALGVTKGEKQRDIVIIDMKGRGHQLNSPAGLPRLFGLPDYHEDGIEYHPMEEIKKRHEGMAGQAETRAQAIGGKGEGFLQFEYTDKPNPLLTPVLFPKLLREVLVAKYKRNLIRMAEDLKIDIDLLDRYLYGALPKTTDEVQKINDLLKMPDDLLVKAWEADALKIIDGLHPIPEKTGPKVREFILMVRKAVLWRGEGSVRSALDDDAIENPKILQTIFNGKFMPSAASLQFLYDFIISTNAESGVGAWEGDRISPEKVLKVEACLKDAYKEHRQTLKNYRQDFSLYLFYLDALEMDGHRVPLRAIYADPAPNAEEQMIEAEMSRLLSAALDEGYLNEREKNVIQQFFGFDGEPKDRAEIARNMGLSKKNVVIKERALRKLRYPWCVEKLLGNPEPLLTPRRLRAAWHYFLFSEFEPSALWLRTFAAFKKSGRKLDEALIAENIRTFRKSQKSDLFMKNLEREKALFRVFILALMYSVRASEEGKLRYIVERSGFLGRVKLLTSDLTAFLKWNEANGWKAGYYFFKSGKKVERRVPFSLGAEIKCLQEKPGTLFDEFDKGVEALDLSAKSARGLRNAGIKRIGQLVNPIETTSARLFKDATLAYEIMATLAVLNPDLNLNMDTQGWVPPETRARQTAEPIQQASSPPGATPVAISDEEKQRLYGLFDKSVDELDLPMRVVIRLGTSNRYSYVGHIVEEKWFETGKFGGNYGKKMINDIIKALADLDPSLRLGMDTHGWAPPNQRGKPDSSGGISMKSFVFPLAFSLFHGLQGEPTELTLPDVIASQPVAGEAISGGYSGDRRVVPTYVGTPRDDDTTRSELLAEPIEAKTHDAMEVREWNAELAEGDEATSDHLAYGDLDLDAYSSGLLPSVYSRFALSPVNAAIGPSLLVRAIR